MLCRTSCRRHLSANKLVWQGPPLLLYCRPADIPFPSDLFLPSCSVGAVCPCARRGNIINMSVIPYRLAQSFLKKFWHFSKIFFHIVFHWSCLNCRLHRPTLPPRSPDLDLHFVQVRKLSGDIEHKCAFSLLNVRICCFSVWFMMINDESLSFRLLFGRKKQSEDVTLGSGKLRIFHTYLTFHERNS